MSTQPPPALVSVIIPVYRVEKYIDACMESVLGQSYKNLEIILIDDGSPDRCGELCDVYAARDARVTVLHKENAGISAARNDGIQTASGEYVVFVDSDDIIARNMIEKMLESRSDDPYALVAVGAKRFSEEERPSLAQDGVPAPKQLGFKELFSLRNGFYCWGILYSARLLRDYRLRFDPALDNLEDAAFNVVCFSLATELRFLDYPAYGYRKTPFSITSHCSDVLWQARSNFRVYKSLVTQAQTLPLSALQRRKVKKLSRTFINSMHGELLAGNCGYRDYLSVLAAEPETLPGELLTVRLCHTYAPWLEFAVYRIAFRLLRKITAKRRHK